MAPPQPWFEPSWGGNVKLLVGTLMLVLLTAGCGGGDDVTTAQPVQTVTVTAEPERQLETAPEQSHEPTQVAPADPVVRQGTIPDVVGMDHQLAQDTMQAAGFYNLSEEDATGQGRMLIIDRNWVVVEQEPAAGTAAAAEVTVILRSKKIGE